MSESQLDFLFNDYHCPIFYIDLLYPTVTHAYEAQKLEIRKNGEERRVIGDLPTTQLVREAGQAIKMTPEYKEWFEANKDRIMSDLLVAKFGQPEMREKLAAITQQDIFNYLEYSYIGVTIMNIKLAQAQQEGGKK